MYTYTCMYVLLTLVSTPVSWNLYVKMASERNKSVDTYIHDTISDMYVWYVCMG